MKDFELTLRLKNNQLKSRRLAKGLTVRQVAEQVGISYVLYLEYEGLRKSPLRSRVGKWRASAEAVAKFYGCTPEELWPWAILAVQLPELVVEVDGEKLLGAVGLAPEALPSPEEEVSGKEQSRALKQALSILPPIEAEVIRLRFGLEDEDGLLEEGDGLARVSVGSLTGLSEDQVESREKRALCRLRDILHG